MQPQTEPRRTIRAASDVSQPVVSTPERDLPLAALHAEAKSAPTNRAARRREWDGETISLRAFGIE
jgi:hypothetical protein